MQKHTRSFLVWFSCVTEMAFHEYVIDASPGFENIRTEIY